MTSMYLFRSPRASAIAKSNANLLADISFLRKKMVNSSIKSILNDCSQIILLLNEGNIDDSQLLKKNLSANWYDLLEILVGATSGLTGFSVRARRVKGRNRRRSRP